MHIKVTGVRRLKASLLADIIEVCEVKQLRCEPQPVAEFSDTVPSNVPEIILTRSIARFL